jgi:hypothetical protein
MELPTDGSARGERSPRPRTGDDARDREGKPELRPPPARDLARGSGAAGVAQPVAASRSDRDESLAVGDTLWRRLVEQQSELLRLRNEIDGLRKAAQYRVRDMAEVERHAAALDHALRTLQTSRSWRLTRPLRRIGARWPGLAALAHRLATFG